MRNKALVITALVALVLPGAALATGRGARAYSARSLYGNDNAYLHLVKTSGSTLIEEGTASGSLPGHVRAEMRIGPTFSGRFTIYTRYGQIRGAGSARPGKAHAGVESFAGTANITGGTGRYSHAHGRGGLYGTFNRHNDALVLQTRGTFSY